MSTATQTTNFEVTDAKRNLLISLSNQLGVNVSAEKVDAKFESILSSENPEAVWRQTVEDAKEKVYEYNKTIPAKEETLKILNDLSEETKESTETEGLTEADARLLITKLKIQHGLGKPSWKMLKGVRARLEYRGDSEESIVELLANITSKEAKEILETLPRDPDKVKAQFASTAQVDLCRKAMKDAGVSDEEIEETVKELKFWKVDSILNKYKTGS